MEEQALSLVGQDVYQKLIKGYTEKQWGRPCRELPSFIIKRIPMRFTYDNNYFDIRYQGVPYGKSQGTSVWYKYEGSAGQRRGRLFQCILFLS